jgi:DNA polymerase-3 subunit epsilon
MTFAAIDFETATSAPNSACAVGIVTVENGIITDEYYSLIQPPKNVYSYWNIKVHGIDSFQTRFARNFAQLFPEIEKRLQHKIIVAHNAGFDKGVLYNSMMHYYLSPSQYPIATNWQCTVKIYQKLGFKPANLAACCQRLNIPLQHHEALSDARACAKLYLNYLQNHQ